jgi:hypothetical protein
MFTWLKRIVILALIVAAVNDTGRYIVALYQLANHTRDIAFAAAQVWRENPGGNSGWPVAARMARDDGLEVIGYQQDQSGVTIATRSLLPGTFVVGRVLALMQHRPIDSPIVLDNRASSSG